MSSELYKSKDIRSKEYRQSERRHTLLKIQRQRRNESNDEHRSIDTLKELFQTKHKQQQHPKYKSFKNQLMLSEWLKEVPDDIENWYIKPCPKGKRVLVIAVDGKTRVYNKYGGFLRQFRSELPGDHRKRDSLTILDCIYIDNLDEYFILDVLAYGNQAFTNCETEFRFFWIESQIFESNLDRVTEHNKHSFRIIEKCCCGDFEAFNEFLTKYPIWPNNEPELDGFLFYHKEVSYVHGQTPLVGWLYPYMLPELFHVPHINDNYMNGKPLDYIDYLTFIKKFDEDLLQKKKNHKHHKHRHIEQMNIDESETIDGNDTISVLKQTMELETNGIDNDIKTDQFSYTNTTNELEMSY